MKLNKYPVCEKCNQEIKNKEDGIIVHGNMKMAVLDEKVEDYIIGDIDEVSHTQFEDGSYAYHIACLTGLFREKEMNFVLTHEEEIEIEEIEIEDKKKSIMCKWKSDNSGFSTNCDKIFLYSNNYISEMKDNGSANTKKMDENYKFCPFCGRKIKYIEKK